MRQLVAHIWSSKDRSSAAFLLVLTLVAAWTIGLPISKTVQKIALERFHLATPRFAAWAIQQPIPAMYNFENRYWASTSPLRQAQLDELAMASGSTTLNLGGLEADVETGAINHFPTRTLTFALARSYLKKQPYRYVYVRSRYRGREINSEFQVRSISDDEIRVRQMEVQLD